MSDAAAAGNRIRREVLGDDYVDRAMATADEFGAPLQQFVAEHCWGGVWARPGLDRKTRSMLNLVMLMALNRPHELRIHVRGAINNGYTVDEIAGLTQVPRGTVKDRLVAAKKQLRKMIERDVRSLRGERRGE